MAFKVDDKERKYRGRDMEGKTERRRKIKVEKRKEKQKRGEK